MGWWGEPKKRIQATGGIKSQSQSFGSSWWAKRWIALLESFNLGARLSRGRSYARGGQVLSISILPGVVAAKVQGSRRTPYSITIKIKPFSEKEWGAAADALAEQALFAAKLMANEMPDTIEEAFQSVKLALLPAKLSEIETDCSCPDYSNPCKHTAAVYFLIGEEFDRDPFLIFQLRGKTREEFLKLLAERGGASGEAGSAEPLAPEPLIAAHPGFWQGEQALTEVPQQSYGTVVAPPVAAALLRRLGDFPFWRGEKSLLDGLTPSYSEASQKGLDLYLSEH